MSYDQTEDEFPYINSTLVWIENILSSLVIVREYHPYSLLTFISFSPILSGCITKMTNPDFCRYVH